MAQVERFEEGAPRPPRYNEVHSIFTPAEMAIFPQVKRMYECLDGDKELRDNVIAGKVTPEQRALLKEIGITFEIEEVSALWEHSEQREQFEQALSAPESDAAERALKLLEQYPILHLWARYRMRRAELYSQQRSLLTSKASGSAAYTAWRMRRIAATKSELGFYGYDIDHPSVAIEMQVGCTVGCYFCAFDAPKLQKVFDYNLPENRTLFQGIATSLHQHLGWSCGHALLYWSTEPADNPHYVEWMKEYRAVTGSSVCTATARADEQWVGKLIAHYRPMRQPWPRISVLTRSIMYKIMKRFTPEEAQDMVLLMQQKDGEESRAKVPGGRDKMLARLAQYDDLRELDVDSKPDDLFVPQGTIACVSGFLINIIEKTIRLISPCYTTEQYRYGYRVFDEVSFTDAADFHRKLENMIVRKCVLEPYGAMPMRFRDDLRYRPKPDGFRITSKNLVHECRGDEIYAPLGEMLHQGTMTYDEVVDDLLERGFNPMMATAAIKGMFDRGFLCELEASAPGEKPLSGQMLQMAH